MNWINNALIKLIIRHLVAAAGAWFVSKGFMSDNDLDKIGGAVAVLAAVGHSLWDKRAQIASELKTLLNMAPLIVLGGFLGCLLLTGCGTAAHQYIDNESGTALKAKIPVGYAGNNFFELDLTIGTFKHTSVIQPITTNQIYAPTMVVVATTKGKFAAEQPASTNTAATTSGGDGYVITTGDATASVTNSGDIFTSAWQGQR